MTDKPLAFRDWGVRALLNVKPMTWPPEPVDADMPCKSQTRRLVKPQPVRVVDAAWDGGEAWRFRTRTIGTKSLRTTRYYQEDLAAAEARFQPGDVFYIKEALVNDEGLAAYRACGDSVEIPPEGVVEWLTWRWKRDVLPAMFMPKQAARPARFEVKEVRCERVSDISPEDCLAEGVINTLGKSGLNLCDIALDAFADAWDAIHTKPGTRFEGNPHVWAYSFMRTA